MDDDVIHLIYGTDDNYWFPTAVSAASAAKGIGVGRRLVIHLFDHCVTDQHYEEYVKTVECANSSVVCKRHQLNEALFTGFGAWRGSFVTYSRMMVPEILEGIDWAIYVDGDTLWLGDIGKLWDLRDSQYLVQASVDPPTPMGIPRPDVVWYKQNGLEVDDDKYFCAGLMLMNLHGMREFGMVEKCRAFMSKYPCPRIVDQTVLNYVLQGHSAFLPPEWGVFSMWHGDVDMSRPCMVHSVNDLPWRRDKINRLISDVVLLWYVFCEDVLGLNLRHRYMNSFSWWWRRLVFLLLKRNQWILKCHPYLKGHLRNTHGLEKQVYAEILERFKRSSK